MQWGVSSGNGAADITFPITFGTLYSITQGFCNSGSVNNWNWAISSYSVSKFHVLGKGGIGLFWIAVGKAQQWGVINAPAFPDNGQPVTFPIKFSKIPSVITAINQAKNSVSSTQLFTASINAYTTTSNMILHRYGGLTSSDARVDWFAWSV